MGDLSDGYLSQLGSIISRKPDVIYTKWKQKKYYT
jgi:hypothetical protein